MGVREITRAEAATVRELVRDRGLVRATPRFEWTVVGLCTWLMSGAYLDAWAHRHLARLETFFTPWHAVLYSGMFAVLAFLAITALRNRAREAGANQALPAGYALSLAGCALFAIGAALVTVW